MILVAQHIHQLSIFFIKKNKNLRVQERVVSGCLRSPKTRKKELFSTFFTLLVKSCAHMKVFYR